jgi:hypothetical protein
MACPAADWEAAIRACLRTVRIPATATFGAEILRRTDPEIADDVEDIRTRYRLLSPAAQSVAWFVYEAQWACNRRVRELEIEYRFNVVFENRRGHPQWGDKPLWPEVIAALEAVPEEHLSHRRGATQPMVFRRLAVDPAATTAAQAATVAGRTHPARGEIEIYDPGVGSAPYMLGIPRTSWATRHEVGHSVEPLVDPAEKQRFKEQIVGWRDYSWDWISNPKIRPTPICDPAHAPLQAEACELCWELGFLGPALACDAAALDAFLAKVDTAEQVRGDRTYRRDAHFMASFVTVNVPSLPEFTYARTNFGDYFAEVYMFALSRPEWLHLVLPAAQTSWLKEHVFSTRSHYDQIVAPVLAQMGAVGIAFRLLAQLQFTKQQLLNVAAQAGSFLQPQP